MANLLVTYSPTHSEKALDEALAVLKSVGEDAKMEESPVDGTFLITVTNPRAAVKNLLKAFKEDPEQFHYTHRWVPVDKWVSSEIRDMLAVLREFDRKMDPEKSWKMDIHKRGVESGNLELIKKLTEAIEKQNVNLKDPDVIVNIEILGGRAALSLLSKCEYLNTAKK